MAKKPTLGGLPANVKRAEFGNWLEMYVHLNGFGGGDRVPALTQDARTVKSPPEEEMLHEVTDITYEKNTRANRKITPYLSLESSQQEAPHDSGWDAKWIPQRGPHHGEHCVRSH